MKPLIISVLCIPMVLALQAVSCDAADGGEQFYEIRSYVLGEKGDASAVDQYLSEALLPALNRHGVGTVGVFTNAENDQSGSPRIVVAIPYSSTEQMVKVRSAVQADAGYQAAAKDFFSRNSKDAAYQRIQSELLSAMECWPKLIVPDGSLSNSDRVYELRVYESAHERLGNLKVDMFNNGEVPIFLDCQITPIFIGQGVVGPQTPNLTYLTMYPSDEARVKAWQDFRSHPDWQVLKKVQKYKGTVSSIDTFIMVPKTYSQM